MQAPKLPSVFKHKETRGFNYLPLYYNEQKERLEERRRKIAPNKEASEKGEYRRPTAISFHNVPQDKSPLEYQAARRAKINSSNRNLLLILVALMGMVYYIIQF